MTPSESVLNKMAAMCSRREYPEKSILTRLQRYENLSGSDIANIINKLKALGFINDERFALSYANDKARFNKWGSKKIAVMLKSLGIGDNIISKAISEIHKDQFQSTCLQLLTDKLKTIKGGDSNQIKAKLFRFGLGRGFSYDEVSEAVNSLKIFIKFANKKEENDRY